MITTNAVVAGAVAYEALSWVATAVLAVGAGKAGATIGTRTNNPHIKGAIQMTTLTLDNLRKQAQAKAQKTLAETVANTASSAIQTVQKATSTAAKHVIPVSTAKFEKEVAELSGRVGNVENILMHLLKELGIELPVEAAQVVEQAQGAVQEIQTTLQDLQAQAQQMQQQEQPKAQAPVNQQTSGSMRIPFDRTMPDNLSGSHSI